MLTDHTELTTRKVYDLVPIGVFESDKRFITVCACKLVQVNDYLY